MPLVSVNLNTAFSWEMERTNTSPFGVTNEGPDEQDFTLQGLSVTTWNALFAETYTLAAALAVPGGVGAVLASGGTLTVGQPYYYVVTTTGGTGETSASAEVTATPTSGSQSITVSWSAVSGASGYKVYRGTASGAETLLVETVGSGSTVSWTDTGAAGSGGSAPYYNSTSYVEFSLLSWTSLVNETVSLAHALTLQILPSGGQGLLTPGSSNGLTWFFSGSNPGIELPVSGTLLYSLPSTATGQVVDSTHNTLRLYNLSTSASHTSTVLLLGSTT